MGDTETFKLILLLIGNSCEPSLIRRWTMMAESTTKAEKRARHVEVFLNNADQKSHLWFYFDVYYNKLLYLNGLRSKREQLENDLSRAGLLGATKYHES